MVDDLDDERSEEELRAQYKKSTFSQLAPLFLFRREEKQKYQESLSSFTEAKTKLQESIERRVKVPESPGTCDAPCSLPPGNDRTPTLILGQTVESSCIFATPILK